MAASGAPRSQGCKTQRSNCLIVDSSSAPMPMPHSGSLVISLTVTVALLTAVTLTFRRKV